MVAGLALKIIVWIIAAVLLAISACPDGIRPKSLVVAQIIYKHPLPDPRCQCRDQIQS